MKSKTMLWILPAAVLSAVLILLIAPIGLGRTELLRAIEDTMHAPLFALVAVSALVWLRQLRPLASFRSEYLRAFAVAVALGALGEVLQSMTTSRHAEWRDLVLDTLGAIAGLAIWALFDRRRNLRTRLRRKLVLVAVLAGIAIAIPASVAGIYHWYRWQQLPDLVTWQSALGYRFVSAGSGEVAVTMTPAPWNSLPCEVALQFSPGANDEWPGITIEEPASDWSAYSLLSWELVNPSDAELRYVLRVNDRRHNNRFADRYNATFAVPPRSRKAFTVPISDIANAPTTRRMDMKRISRIVMFQNAKNGAQSFYLCSMRLGKR